MHECFSRQLTQYPSRKTTPGHSSRASDLQATSFWPGLWHQSIYPALEWASHSIRMRWVTLLTVVYHYCTNGHIMPGSDHPRLFSSAFCRHESGPGCPQILICCSQWYLKRGKEEKLWVGHAHIDVPPFVTHCIFLFCGETVESAVSCVKLADNSDQDFWLPSFPISSTREGEPFGTWLQNWM